MATERQVLGAIRACIVLAVGANEVSGQDVKNLVEAYAKMKEAVSPGQKPGQRTQKELTVRFIGDAEEYSM